MVCTRMVCSFLSRSTLSQSDFEHPRLHSSSRDERLHVVKALHCSLRAGPHRKHLLVVRVAALLTRQGLKAVELATKTVVMLGALQFKKGAPAGVAAEETELSRPSHRSMLRLLTVESAE